MPEYIERGAAKHAADLAFDMTETEYDMLCKELDRVPAADVIERPQWISVTDRLPDTETEVLAVCNRNGFRFVCPAIYEDGTVLTQDSMWSWYDLDNYETYSEENDDYFIPEGWWENRQFTPDDVYNNPVDCSVTHWMPLPLLPDRTSENCPKVWPPDEL